MTQPVAAGGDRIRSEVHGRGATNASPSRLSNLAAPTLDWEERAWGAGARTVAGLDEVGRGAWAGPVLAAAVVLRPDADCAALAAVVRDSKQLSAQERCAVYPIVRRLAPAVAIGQASAYEVDALGIARANGLAMRRALWRLHAVPDVVLVDGYPVPGWRRPQEAIVGGDRQVAAIAAASVVAKVTRDAAMIGLAARYPGYGFDAHKGYGTAEHRQAVDRLGPTAEHRLTWAPLRAVAAT